MMAKHAMEQVGPMALKWAETILILQRKSRSSRVTQSRNQRAGSSR